MSRWDRIADRMKQREIAYERRKENGIREYQVRRGLTKTCPTCHGSGRIEGTGGGTGRWGSRDKPCPICNGEGVVKP